MTNKHDWEQFFDGHAPVYMDNCFVTNTLAEVDFIIEELRLEPGSRILDIGCGTGRHSVELAKRGFKMTGVDLSSGMLAEATKAAAEAGVEIELIHADATQFTTKSKFDAAICLCEGAFCLMGLDEDPLEHDLAILRNIAEALKPGAPFMLTTLNGMRKIRKCQTEDIENGTFDPITTTEIHTMEWDTPEGKQSVELRERGYVPGELILLCQTTGLEVDQLYGGTAGNWGRRPIDLDEIEIMVIARKAE